MRATNKFAFLDVLRASKMVKIPEMSAKPNTDEGDELDVLATLVDAYEAKHFPIESADPIEALLGREV